MAVHLHNEINTINTRGGVRQGCTISHKLFTAAPESIFRRLTWKTRDWKIDSEYLSHLRFADDIRIRANTQHELQQMLQELADESESPGLKMYNDTPTLRSRTLKAMSTWDRDTAPETKNKTRRFKEESRPGEQPSPSTATPSRVTLEHDIIDKPTTHVYFLQWHTAWKLVHSPAKQRTS